MATKTKTRWSWLFHHKLIAGFLVLLILVGLGLVIDSYRTSAEKRNFEKARSAIDSIYNNIVTEFGKPDDYLSQNYCNASHEVFSKPTYTCYVSTNLLYGVNDISEANSKLQGVQNIILINSTLKSPKVLSRGLSKTFASGIFEYRAKDEYAYHSLSCSVIYEFNTPSRVDLRLKDKTKKPLEILFSCSGTARSPYYHLSVGL